VDTGPSIHGKRIALLREVAPSISKLACLTLRIQWEGVQGPAMRAAAEVANISLLPALLELPSSAAAYENAIVQASRDGANAMMVLDGPDTMSNRNLIVNLINEARVPAIYPFAEFAEAGGLLAYSFDLVELNKRIANNVDAILRGADPGEIPFYQPSKFVLSVNVKTANALGITMPATLMASADNVIE
jgi:putative ABC transport system substrate-binding protein